MDGAPKYNLKQFKKLGNIRTVGQLRDDILKILVFGLESKKGKKLLSGAFRFDRSPKGGTFWHKIAYPEMHDGVVSEEHLEEAKLELLAMLQSIDALEVKDEV